MIPLNTFEAKLVGVRSDNANMRMRTCSDPSIADEWVLEVQYPPECDDAAGRDIWIDVATDWSSGETLSFRARAEGELQLSVSFFDRNRVAYTTWIMLSGGSWQDVLIRFADMRPNPYFQLDDAFQGQPIDVSEVRRLGIAPQTDGGGQFMLGRFVLRTRESGKANQLKVGSDKGP